MHFPWIDSSTSIDEMFIWKKPRSSETSQGTSEKVEVVRRDNDILASNVVHGLSNLFFPSLPRRRLNEGFLNKLHCNATIFLKGFCSLQIFWLLLVCSSSSSFAMQEVVKYIMLASSKMVETLETVLVSSLFHGGVNMAEVYRNKMILNSQ